MRITELLEGKHFDDLKFVKTSNNKGERELDFDLPDDLIFFMQNDDEAYRRHLYPIIAKCLTRVKSNKSFKPTVFEKAIHECYKLYNKEYPIKELPSILDDKLINETCEKLYTEFTNHIAENKYD